MLTQQFQQALTECPLIAIIRGVKPTEVEAVAETLLEEGVRIIEIPLNSPEPLRSLELLARRMEGRGLCGAGTVLTTAEVSAVKNAGGQLIISPNCNPDVIKATLAAELMSLPGCLTPTEIFSAIAAGADHIKLFPAGDLGTSYVASLFGPLPKNITTLAVGGIDEHNMAAYWQAGTRGFGLGSNLYQAGDSVEQIRVKARTLMAAARQLPRG
ncbi:MAG: 2-dehydro-3-deoxy-6-phosphogalactonate aldolase [Gammaproteobacteria bacterium]|nr:2-dehydro-3-deoxy-6-phosphogalactonate aldolase [Gammaproteobacteria bacterium]